MITALQEEWKKHFVAYEDALGSFYSLEDATEATLEQSRALASQLRRLASLRSPVLDARRRLRALADSGRVAEIERNCATIELDGARFDVLDLVATHGGADDTLLELSFRVDPRSISRFVKLTEPVRIRFPFGESTFVACCRLVRFRLVREQFAFRFAIVDPA